MDREGLVFLAKLAEDAERYEEMTEHVQSLAAVATTELSTEERSLLSVAYKNAAGMRRASWRVVSAIDKYDKHRAGDHSLLSAKLRATIEDELTQLCQQLIAVVDDKLLPRAESADARVFYLKMKADYARYMAEYASDSKDQRKRVVEAALRDYELAQKIAEAELVPTDATRLGLALNHSVFYFDILHDTRAACALAKRAFDDAIAELDTLSDDSYKDSTLIMQLLRDNITLWTSEPEDEGEEDGGAEETP